MPCCTHHSTPSSLVLLRDSVHVLLSHMANNQYSPFLLPVFGSMAPSFSRIANARLSWLSLRAHSNCFISTSVETILRVLPARGAHQASTNARARLNSARRARHMMRCHKDLGSGPPLVMRVWKRPSTRSREPIRMHSLKSEVTTRKSLHAGSRVLSTISKARSSRPCAPYILTIMLSVKPEGVRPCECMSATSSSISSGRWLLCL